MTTQTQAQKPAQSRAGRARQRVATAIAGMALVTAGLGLGCSQTEAEWKTYRIEAAGRTFQGAFPAKPKKSGSHGISASYEDFGVWVRIHEEPSLAELIQQENDKAGHQVAERLTELNEDFTFTYSQMGTEVAGLTGIQFKAEGAFGGNRSRIRAVWDGGTVILFGCETDGGLGVGKRIPVLNDELCPRFWDEMTIQ